VSLPRYINKVELFLQVLRESSWARPVINKSADVNLFLKLFIFIFLLKERF